MTTCTERELLEGWLNVDWQNVRDETQGAEITGLLGRTRAFLADTPACDAEKAAKTFWNGYPAKCRRVVVIVGHAPVATWWCAEFEGTERDAVEISKGNFAGGPFLIDDEDGAGWWKVTEAEGGPEARHRSLPPDSRILRERHPDPSPAAAALLAQGERLERAEGLLSRIQMLLNGDNDRFGAMHYFGQAWPLYDGTRNDPVMDARHATMLSWYLRAFQSVSDGRARAAPGEETE